MAEHREGARVEREGGSPSLAAWAYLLGLLGLALYLCWSHFAQPLAAGLTAAVLLALTVLTCTGMGRLALKMYVATHMSESERTLIGCTLGLGILSQGMLLLAATGALKPVAVVLLFSVLWVLSFTEMRDVVLSLAANRSLLRGRSGWTAFLAALLCLTFWTAWVPPHQYDSLVYHLELPAYYLRHGGLTAQPPVLFGHFPQNGEMLFMFALMLGSDLLAQMFSWLATALSLWWMFEMGKREMPINAALLACVLAASHTAVMLLSSITYVETLAMLWVTASVLCFCRWREIEGSRDGWLLLSALFAGLGVGTKYYVGICPAAIGLYLVIRRAWRPALRFGLCAAVVGSPWLIRNWLSLGNPFFPFLYQHFPYRGTGWGPENAKRYFSALTDYGHGHGQFFSDLLAFPFLAFTGNLRFGGGADVLGNLGWGLLLALTPLAAWAAFANRSLRRMLGYCAFHAAVWFSTGVVLRFLTVLVPLLSLPAAAGFHRLWRSFERGGKTLLAAALALFILCNLGFFFYVHTVLSSWRLLSGAESRNEYLSRRLDYYPCALRARERLGKNDRILIVGEQRGYYVQQDHVATTVMAPNRFVEWADRSSSPVELAGLLKSEGKFTHLLLVPREGRRLSGYGIFSFSPAGIRNWEGLERAGLLEPVYASDSCALMAIKD